MTQQNMITLGSQTFEVKPIPLGRLKRVLPAVSEVTVAMAAFGDDPAGAVMTEADYDHAVVAIGEAIGLTRAEVEALPADLPQVLDAISVIAEVAGLRAKGPVDLGEVMPGMTPAMASTLSTDSLPTS